MNVFQYVDYKKFVHDFIDSKKKTQHQMGFTRLADRIGIQRSYLSRVLHGTGDLSPDQLYLLGKELELSNESLGYLQLLLEIERCQVPDRKKNLVEKREKKRNSKLRSEIPLGRKAIQPSDPAFLEYYSNSLYPVAHMCLTIPEFLENPLLLCKKLSITKETLGRILNTLEKCEVLKVENGKHHLLQPTLHLSGETYLSRVYATQFRLKAIEYQQRRDDETDYFFTSSFTATEEDRLAIKEKFLDFLKWLSTRVEKAPAKEVFHMNFDLFRV